MNRPFFLLCCSLLVTFAFRFFMARRFFGTLSDHQIFETKFSVLLEDTIDETLAKNGFLFSNNGFRTEPEVIQSKNDSRMTTLLSFIQLLNINSSRVTVRRENSILPGTLNIEFQRRKFLT